ncbi:hypothetical protein ACTA71_004406 [Dictyostelium dimigraforme]
MNSIIKAWPKGFTSFNTFNNIKITQLKTTEYKTIIKRFYLSHSNLNQSQISKNEEHPTSLEEPKEFAQKMSIRNSPLSDQFSQRIFITNSPLSDQGAEEQKEFAQKMLIPNSPISDRRAEEQINNEKVKSQIYLKSKFQKNDVYQTCNKKLKDENGEIDIIKFKEILMNQRDEEFVKHLFGWCTNVMKTTNITIIESFIVHFRNTRSMEFIKVLDYIDKTDMAQSILIINMTLFFYTEMNMMEAAKKLVSLLFSMGSSLPEKTYLAILRSFERDIDIIKLLEKRVEQDTDLGVPVRLLNELICVYLKDHRDIESALTLIEKLESSGSQLYQYSVIALIVFFNNNRMPEKSINLLKNISDKYPEWFRSVKFLLALSPHLYPLMPFIDQLLDHMDENNSTSKVFYNKLIQVSSENISRNWVIKLYNRMIKQYVPDSSNIKDLIYLAVRDENLQECLYWYKVSSELNFKLTSKIATYLLRFFTRIGHFEPIDDIIANCSADRSLCTPWNVGSIIYFLDIVKGDLLPKSKDQKVIISSSSLLSSSSSETSTTATTDQSKKYLDIYKEYYNFIKSKPNQFIEETTDSIIQTCLIHDKYEDAKRWYRMKIEDFNVLPTIYTFSNFLSYHTLRMEHNEWTYWKKEMKENYKNIEIDRPEQAIFDFFNKYYKNKKSFNESFESLLKKKGTEEVIGKFYLLFNQNSQKEAFEYFENCANNQTKDSNYFIPRDFYLRVLVLSLEHSNLSYIKLTYRLLLEVGGIVPTYEIIQRVVDRLYALNRTEFENFFTTIPKGVQEEHYRIAYATTLSKSLPMKTFINHISKPENLDLVNNGHVRNGFLLGLLNSNLIDYASRLLGSLLNSKSPEIETSTLQLYLEKVVELEYNTNLLALVSTHFNVNNISDNKNQLTLAVASVSLLKGDIKNAYKIIKEVLSIPNISLNITYMKLAVRIYSKYFPTPPDTNLDYLLTLIGVAEPMRIHRKVIYLEIFKCLTEDGRTDLIRKILKGPFTFVELSQDLIFYILFAYKDQPPERLFRFANLILKKCNISDQRTINLINQQHDLLLKSSNTVDIKNIYPLVYNLIKNQRPPTTIQPQLSSDNLVFINRYLILPPNSQISTTI